MAGKQGVTNAGVPPGQKCPNGHGVLALAALTDPAGQPKPGAAVQGVAAHPTAEAWAGVAL